MVFGMINRTVIILCGGMGTRSSNPNLPKSLQAINGQSLIAIQLEALHLTSNYELFFIAGWQGAMLSQEVEKLMQQYPEVKWEIHIEEKPQGTTLAALRVLSLVSSNNIMLLSGDLYLKGNLGRYFDVWEEYNSEVLLICHPNSHPHDSDLISYDITSLQANSLLPKNRSADITDGNMALAGLLLIKRESLTSLQTDKNEIVEAIFDSRDNITDIKVWPVIDIIMDVGTPERLAKAAAIDGKFSEGPSRALFLDLDGTILENQEIKTKNSNIEMSPRILRELSLICQMHIPIFIVTNQPGIAKGFFTWEDFNQFRCRFESALSEKNVFISRWYVCPHHPDSGYPNEINALKKHCECRKPGDKFARDAANDYLIDLESSTMIGDTEADAGFAKTSGMRFIKVQLDDVRFQNKGINTWDALRRVAQIK
jgi:mannose-1-phosphate guanylyltransferase/phosphomannomutase